MGSGRQASLMIRFKKTDGRAKTPTKAYPGDAGFDLYVSETTHIQSNSSCDVPIGIAVELPSKMWGRVCGRSSTFRVRNLLVIEGVIDQGYRGPLFVHVCNMNSETVVIVQGERVAQFIPHEVQDSVWKEVDQIAPSHRGGKGFGSSGT